ncbi:uncharacterized membrane protein HdeD (DUF308 family) [Bradyrhizobium elkanii]
MLSILGWIVVALIVVLVWTFGSAALGAGIGNLIAAFKRKKPAPPNDGTR